MKSTISKALQEKIVSLCEYVCATEEQDYQDRLSVEEETKGHAYSLAAEILAKLKK